MSFESEGMWLRQASATGQLTLDGVNHCLRAVGLAEIDETGLTWLQRYPRQIQLQSALEQAAANPQAKAFLERLHARIPPRHGSDGTRPPAAPRPRGFHIYGSETAVYCYTDTARSGAPTVAFDGARSGKETGSRQYAWEAKITVQLTGKELVALLGWLEHREGEIEFKHHGAERDKALFLKTQPDGAYIRLIQRGRAAVGIGAQWMDLVHLHAMTLAQFRVRYPDLTEATLRNLVISHRPERSSVDG